MPAALNNALSVTVDLIGREVGGLFGRVTGAVGRLSRRDPDPTNSAADQIASPARFCRCLADGQLATGCSTRAPEVVQHVELLGHVDHRCARSLLASASFTWAMTCSVVSGKSTSGCAAFSKAVGGSLVGLGAAAPRSDSHRRHRLQFDSSFVAPSSQLVVSEGLGGVVKGAEASGRSPVRSMLPMSGATTPCPASGADARPSPRRRCRTH